MKWPELESVLNHHGFHYANLSWPLLRPQLPKIAEHTVQTIFTDDPRVHTYKETIQYHKRQEVVDLGIGQCAWVNYTSHEDVTDLTVRYFMKLRGSIVAFFNKNVSLGGFLGEKQIWQLPIATVLRAVREEAQPHFKVMPDNWEEAVYEGQIDIRESVVWQNASRSGRTCLRNQA